MGILRVIKCGNGIVRPRTPSLANHGECSAIPAYMNEDDRSAQHVYTHKYIILVKMAPHFNCVV